MLTLMMGQRMSGDSKTFESARKNAILRAWELKEDGEQSLADAILQEWNLNWKVPDEPVV